MSRVAKTLKNARVGLFFYSIVVFVHFFSRKYFLQYLGDEFMGITATLRSILGFLNLAELGIGTAVGFALYKPLFDKNNNEINKIIALVGFIYKKIGYLILIGGVIVSFFFPIIFTETNISLPIIYFAFYSFLASSLISYFYNYHLILLEADQKAYVVTSYFQSINIIRLILQTFLAYYTQSFFVWIFLELFFSTIYAFILRRKVSKEYPWLLISSKGSKELLGEFKSLTKKIKQTFVHKISAFVLGSTDQLLIFSIINAKSVAYFGNYQLIFGQINNLLNSFFKGSGASIGNLVAENNKENINKIFWELMSIRYLIGGVVSICIFYLFEPFIKLWLGEKYILNQLVLVLMIVNFLISQVRVPVENFKNAYGLFSDTWAPIVEMLLNLGVSIIFGKLWGISGIMLGTLCSLILIVVIWKPYFLYKAGFKTNFGVYWKGNLKLMTSLILSYYIIDLFIKHFISNENLNTFFQLIIYALKISFLTVITYVPILYILNKGFRDLSRRALNMVKQLKK
ncbi:O-antigen/teichoic acid export membrane protein [Jejuia pallidilutea]|uniref:O-antigen/teichoic acid export membrane protein n=1 Tax=Jejuia pallidilutea TaxID=504487 RepID=A0A362X532_9FLAO|nr:sugar transporter [Jejuia pallidilutea]PQV47697.1 O-antigen/teichoic acid export membrane protein [Jejuia pallidilutea]